MGDVLGAKVGLLLSAGVFVCILYFSIGYLLCGKEKIISVKFSPCITEMNFVSLYKP